MKCPKCNYPRVKITHTYSIGGVGNTQRGSCPRCHTVITAQTILVNVNPPFGEGAASLAKKLQESKDVE